MASGLVVWPARQARLRLRAARATGAAVAAGATTALLQWSRPAWSFAPPPAAGASASAGALSALQGVSTGTFASSATAVDSGSDGLPQLLLAANDGPAPFISPFQETGADAFFYAYILISLAIVIVALYIITKPYWEQRWLIEKINSAKFKFITQEEDTTPIDKYELGRLYTQLPDYPSALAEYEEVEEDFEGMRRVLDPEDAMGALAARAMLHNSKGFALTNLEPPRTAQARREYVRAVTFWPEYPEGLLNIGRELIKRKRYDVALRTLTTALKWQPGSQVIQEAHAQAQEGVENPDDYDA